jgi:hypothetical protein
VQASTSGPILGQLCANRHWPKACRLPRDLPTSYTAYAAGHTLRGMPEHGKAGLQGMLWQLHDAGTVLVLFQMSAQTVHC